MTHDLDARRRRLRYRATHTGTRETDILLGDFVARLGDGLTPEEVAAAERLLAANDVDILNWIAGRAAVPARFDTPFMGRLRRDVVSRRRP